MPLSREQISQQRDAKVRASLQGFAPVWMVNDEFRPREDALVFHLVYMDPSYGWMNRRFKYDGFNDVLYHLGWRLLTEDETLGLQEQEPYLPGEVATHIPNTPGSRASAGGVPMLPR